MFDIKIFEGTEEIKFGMTSGEISEILQESPKKIRKSGVDTPVDEYDFGFVYFDKKGKCEGIEFFKPAQVKLDGKVLLGKSTKEILKLFLQMDKNLEIESRDAFSSIKYSIGIYGENGKVETVYVGKKGCYEE